MGEHISQYYDLLAHAYKYARMLIRMHTIVAGGQPSQDYDIFAHACKHVHVQEHFFCQ